MREVNIDARSDAEVAAWFIYLNRTAYNGLYRVNRANGFNVPFGRYANPTICDEPTLRAGAAALKAVELLVADFEVVARRGERGDFVYFDPFVHDLYRQGFRIDEVAATRMVNSRAASRGVSPELIIT